MISQIAACLFFLVVQETLTFEKMGEKNYIPNADQLALLEQAIAYRDIGDIYQSVKLYRLLVKQAPLWITPHLSLAAIYKQRKEWKAVAHYNKKSVVLDPSLQDAWWDLSLGVFAIGKKRQAQRIWQKFGHQESNFLSLCSVQISHHGLFELIWVKPNNPLSGTIISIPHPQSDHRYQDTILFDRKLLGYNIFEQKKIPVFECLDLLKRSHFNTFSGIVYDINDKEITLFEQLASAEGIGFEVWSNAARSFQFQKDAQSLEYYAGNKLFPNQKASGVVIALSGRTTKKIKRLIKAWEVICLKTVEKLEQHH